MRYIKLYESFDIYNESYIKETCIKYKIKDYKINDDYTIDVFDETTNLGSHVTGEKLNILPLKFNKVNRFTCCGNNLTSLEGAPIETKGDFNCNENKLTSFIGAPKYVGGYFSCNYNNILTFEGAPLRVKSKFWFGFNPISNIYDIINGEKATSYIAIKGTETHLFEYKSDIIEMLNDYDAIRNINNKGIIILDRFNEFLKNIGRDPVKFVKGYKCI